ncbi:kinase-like protein [Aspergillus stella-maris]|uniref:kinase-like protein n=1 Tax=Aspergillus stella-maris TaxID=1810926 RepID=UPI003CCD8D64
MEIVNRSEGFKTGDSGRLAFAYVQYFVQQDGILYRGKWHDRFNDPEMLNQLDDVQEVQTKDRGPEIQDSWSQIYIKMPSLFQYATADLEDQLRREVSVCESLKKNPHPNIAVYYGCQETNDRVSALCFKRYKTTLHLRVNPGHLNKNMFRERRDLVDDTVKASLKGILASIEHLHSLGLVHNDINPSNIMFDEHDNPVLIDFGSCRRIGENLYETGSGRTPYWYDPQVEMAETKNDLDAFEELKIWLVGGLEEKFLFGS